MFSSSSSFLSNLQVTAVLVSSLMNRNTIKTADALSILGCLALQRTPIDTIASATQKAAKHYSSTQDSTATEQDHPEKSTALCLHEKRKREGLILPVVPCQLVTLEFRDTTLLEEEASTCGSLATADMSTNDDGQVLLHGLVRRVQPRVSLATVGRVDS